MAQLNTMATAANIIEMVRQSKQSTQCFQFTPATGAIEIDAETVRPPLITVTGGKEELSALLQCYDLWDGTLKIGVLDDQGLLDFWMY